MAYVDEIKNDSEYSEEDFERLCAENSIEIKNVDAGEMFSLEKEKRKKRYDILKQSKGGLSVHEVPRLKFKNFIYITIAGFFNAFAVYCFLIPAGLFDGSMSGTAIIFAKLIPNVSLSIFLFALNIPLFIFASRQLSRTYFIYSLYAVTMYSLWTFVLQQLKLDTMFIEFLKRPFINNVASSDNYVVLICCMFGGFLSGAASGAIIRNGATLDGIEVIAVLLSKKLPFTVGQLIMAYNVIMLSVAAILFNPISAFLSIIAYIVAGKAIDMVVEGFDKTKAAFIISDRGLEIAKELNNELKSGVTIINGQGFFHNNSKKIVYFVVNRFEISIMRDIVMAIDKNAFIAINDVTDIFGKSIRRRKTND